MTRPDECFRWVIEREGNDPVVARWDAHDDQWTFPDAEWDTVHTEDRVHKVGIGGSIDQPPTEWEDDIPPTPRREPVWLMADIVRATVQNLAPKIADHIAKNNALLAHMKKRGP